VDIDMNTTLTVMYECPICYRDSDEENEPCNECLNELVAGIVLPY
jgi:hypothetical protein